MYVEAVAKHTETLILLLLNSNALNGRTNTFFDEPTRLHRHEKIISIKILTLTNIVCERI